MKKNLILVSLITIGLLVRFSFFQPYGADIENFFTTAQIAARGGNIYVEQYYYNYSPLPGLICALLLQVPLPFLFTFRLFITLCNLTLALLAALILGGFDTRSGWVGFIVVWFNPALITFIGWDAQFEIVALIPLFVAVWARNKPRLFWLSCTLALAIKHIVFPQIWALYVWRWGWKRGGLRMIASLAMFALLFTPYLPEGLDRIWSRVIMYSSWSGYYGLQLFLPRGLNAVLFYGVMFVLPIIAKRESVIDTLILQTGAFFLFSYGMGNNLLTVLLIVFSLSPNLTLLALTLASMPSLYINWWVSPLFMNYVFLALLGVGLGHFRHPVYQWRKMVKLV